MESTGTSLPQQEQHPPGTDDQAIATMDTTHLARFEFSDAGTKILMVEWLPDAASNPAPADPPDTGADGSTPAQVGRTDAGKATLSSDSVGWEVSWPGKSVFLGARDAEVVPASPQDPTTSLRRRVFFLLPPTAPVPATVTLTPPGSTPIELKPLPAIFPEGFMDVESGQGTRGVLHTIWAKKRLRELEREMDAEMRANAESVGLDMALAEKQWIVDNFLQPPAAPSITAATGMTPITPRTPTGGRLSDKLKGLRLGTSAADLAPSPTANTFTVAGSQSHTLSPHGGDVAISSFSSISRPPIGGASSTGPVSLDAALKGNFAPQQTTDDDDLFALPMSPRSPDMKKSPFSSL